MTSIWFKGAAIALALTASPNTAWLNTAPLTPEAMRGKVVLVNFWTYSCINSLRTLPYLRAWSEKYKKDGLIVLGVHTPEFAFEKVRENVQTAVDEMKVRYPIVMDSDYRIWNAFGNDAWPGFYLVDGNGRIRKSYFGEGDYDKIERDIQALLRENGVHDVSSGAVQPGGAGIEAPPDFADAQSPETYVGSERAENGVKTERLRLNQWHMSGPWNVGAESALLERSNGKIAFRFHSRDLHLVLGSGNASKPIRFRVSLDGVPPGADCGGDCASDGTGTVRQPRLYQLIRQSGAIRDRTFEIEFLDPGVRVYVFTFG
jgi:thiol-disulfide isomerase/thioredoxin